MSMTASRRLLNLCCAALIIVTIAVIGLSCRILLWPAWQQYQAAQAVTKARTDNDFPAFQKAIERLRTTYGDAAAVAPLTAALGDSDDRFRREAASALGSIGPVAKDAAAALVEALKDTKPHGHDDEYHEALVQFGRVALNELMSGLDNADSKVRKWSAELLGRIGPDAAPAIPRLMELLADKHESESVRAISARALGYIDREGKTSIPVLIDATKDESFGVRLQAMGSLGVMGSNAKEAVPALVALLREPEDTFRLNVAWSLGRIFGLHEATVPTLLDAMTNPDLHVRLAAMRSLWFRRDEAELFVPALIEALADEHRDIRMAAASVLLDCGSDGRAAIPALKQRIRDPEEGVRSWATAALMKLDPEFKQGGEFPGVDP